MRKRFSTHRAQFRALKSNETNEFFCSSFASLLDTIHTVSPMCIERNHRECDLVFRRGEKKIKKNEKEREPETQTKTRRRRERRRRRKILKNPIHRLTIVQKPVLNQFFGVFFSSFVLLLFSSSSSPLRTFQDEKICVCGCVCARACTFILATGPSACFSHFLHVQQ